MRRFRLPLLFALVFAGSCRSAAPPAPIARADDIVEGRAAPSVVTDTVDAATASIAVARARWGLRRTPDQPVDFWGAIAGLDIPGAERAAAQSVEKLTFVAALKTLMDGQPDASAVAFRAVHRNAADPLVRARARVGLTMALSWYSDWSAMSTIGEQPDTIAHNTGSLALSAGLERWARALQRMPTPTFEVPDREVVLPMQRSAFGTPVVTVRVNGRPYQFWLDTGASMTLLSLDVALAAGVKLAATDTLALGVVAGHVEARAVYVDSMSLGPVLARGLGAAVVDPSVLRFDRRVINGASQPVKIDGMIGTDFLRHLDIVLDAGAGTMTIRRPRPTRVAAKNLFWVGYPVVRFVTRDGQSVLFGLDTGAEASYVTRSLLRKVPRTSVAARRVTFSGLGNERRRSDWVARDVPLSDGQNAVLLRNVSIMPAQQWTFVEFDGVIGSDVALATRMHLDFTNGVFEINRSASLTTPTPGALDPVRVY